MNIKRYKILITGISGFIGSAINKNFEDHELFTIDNLSFGNRNLINIPEECFFVNDIRDRDKVFEIFESVQPDWVIHLAAIHFIPYCNQFPFVSSQINIEGTKNILDASSLTKSVKKMFYASTAAVYPIMNGPISETTPTGPLDIYGLAKLTGEYLCHDFHNRTQIPTIICRFFNAFGPNETNPHLIPAIHQQVLEGKREILLGNLESQRDFIHTSDMAIAIDLLMNQFEHGIDTFNLGCGQEFSVTEIVEAFEKAVGEKITIKQDPKRMRKSDRLHLLADVSKLKALTGWEPKVGILEGIKKLVDHV
jgi:UDP-glucose 4-epimerase